MQEWAITRIWVWILTGGWGFGAALGMSAVAGYLSGVAASGHINPAKWDSDEWKWFAGGAAAGFGLGMAGYLNDWSLQGVGQGVGSIFQGSVDVPTFKLPSLEGPFARGAVYASLNGWIIPKQTRDLINLESPNAGQQMLDAFRDIYQQYLREGGSGTISDLDIIDRNSAHWLARKFNMGIVTHSGDYVVNGTKIKMTYTFDPNPETKYPFLGAPHPKVIMEKENGRYRGDGDVVYRLQWGQVNFNYTIVEGNVSGASMKKGKEYINSLIRYIRIK